MAEITPQTCKDLTDLYSTLSQVTLHTLIIRFTWIKGEFCM